MGLEEGRKEMEDKKGGGGGKQLQKKRRKKEKKGELKPDTQELRPTANVFSGYKRASQGRPHGSSHSLHNVPRAQPLIYNRLTANILQVPLGTSEDRKKSKRN